MNYETTSRIYNSLGTIVRALGEWDKAMGYHKKSLEISEELGDMFGIAISCGNIGTVYYEKGEWDKALEHQKKSLEIFEELEDMSGIAKTYGNLGEVFHKFQETLIRYLMLDDQRQINRFYDLEKEGIIHGLRVSSPIQWHKPDVLI